MRISLLGMFLVVVAVAIATQVNDLVASAVAVVVAFHRHHLNTLRLRRSFNRCGYNNNVRCLSGLGSGSAPTATKPGAAQYCSVIVYRWDPLRYTVLYAL